MPSSIAVFARPVRIFWRSRLNESTAFFMPSSASLVMSLIMFFPLRVLGELGLVAAADDGADLLAAHDAANVTGSGQLEHGDLQIIVAAQRESRRVHHAQVALQRIG